jgi:monoamine oxidase
MVSPTGVAKRVLIIGAGMSGLAAALELDRGGHSVVVLEAQARPGGRVYTLREPSGSAIADAGAGRIPLAHRWTHRMIHQMGLVTEPLTDGNLRPVVCAEGKRVVAGPDVDLARHFGLTAQEKRLGYAGLVETCLLDSVKRVVASGAVDTPDWPPESLRDLDRCTVEEDLRRRGLSAAAVNLLLVGTFPGSISPLVLGHALATYDRTTLRRIVGGNDALPKAMARHLEGKIVYNAPVRAIRQQPHGVEVAFDRDGMQQTLDADALICTIPFSVLPSVEITPPLSAEKRQIQKQIRYMPTVKVAIKVSSRYWERDGLSGFAELDSSAEIWSVPPADRGDSGVLLFYQTAGGAERMDALDEEGRLRFALDAIERAFPGVSKHVVGSAQHSWGCDPWARGAYGLPAPGDVFAWAGVIARPEGRIHFAGEHTSEYPAWIEGALRSGHRAANEVSAATYGL